MSFKVDHETIPLTETVYNGIQEQGIELEQILPDYFPEIFRMVKCEAVPEILSYVISDGKIDYELCVSVNILYCSENSEQLNTLRQKLTYQKSADFSKNCENCEAVLKPVTDYVNCRVVNSRRIDVKGAVTTKITVSCERQQEMICDAYGMNVQIKKHPVEYTFGKLFADKSTVISEETELSSSKPSVQSIVRIGTNAVNTETRIIANKLVVKGNVEINILYTCEENGKPSMETMKFTLPYSQIMDIDGIDETYKCTVNAETLNADIQPVADKDGNMKRFKCEVTVHITCRAVKTSHTELVTDIYSTRYPCRFSVSSVNVSQPPVSVNEHIAVKYTLEYTEGNIDKVYDAWCSSGNVSVRINEKDRAACISGMIKYSVMLRNSDNKPVLAEKENAYEQNISLPFIEDGCVLEADIRAENCTYNIISSDKIAVCANISVCGRLYRRSEITAVTAVDIDESEIKKKDGDYALKLYFGTAGESIWDIAKLYSTSVKSVMEENDLYEERIMENRMLLIPIVN